MLNKIALPAPALFKAPVAAPLKPAAPALISPVHFSFLFAPLGFPPLDSLNLGDYHPPKLDVLPDPIPVQKTSAAAPKSTPPKKTEKPSLIQKKAPAKKKSQASKKIKLKLVRKPAAAKVSKKIKKKSRR